MKKINLITRIFLAVSVVLLFASASFAQDEGKDTVDSHKEHKDFMMKNMKIEHHGEDTTLIIIHHDRHDWHHGDMGRCLFMSRKGKYNGHWAGIDFGWNGYVNKDFNMSFPSNLKYLDLNSSRSMTVDLNPF